MDDITILVCDDDREIVEAIDIYLRQEGYNVLKAYDGEEAIKLLEEKKTELFRPKKRRRSDAEIAKELITKAKKAGMSSKDIAEKLGLEME